MRSDDVHATEDGVRIQILIQPLPQEIRPGQGTSDPGSSALIRAPENRGPHHASLALMVALLLFGLTELVVALPRLLAQSPAIRYPACGWVRPHLHLILRSFDDLADAFYRALQVNRHHVSLKRTTSET